MAKKKKTVTRKKRQGAAMGRPTISALGVKSKINISIDPDLKKFLDKLDTGRSKFINDALRAAVELSAKSKKKKRTVVKKTGNKTKRKSVRRAKAAA